MKASKSYLAEIHRMRYLLGTLVALVIADGLISQFLIRSGLGREGNPFLETLVGESNFMAIKILGAILSALILWDISRKRPKLALIASLFFVVLYAGIVLWNLGVFFISQA